MMTKGKQTEALRLKKSSFGDFMGKWTSVIATVLIFLFFSITMPDTFLTGDNVVTILRAVSITCIIGIGLTLTMAAGGFDLSIGMMATLANTVCMSFLMWFHFGTIAAIFVTILVCELFSMLTMFIVIRFKVPELLTTLAMQFILDGIAVTYAGAGSVNQTTIIWWSGEQPTVKIPELFTQMGKAPLIIIIMLVSVAVVHVFLNYTKYGRYVYAVGSNKNAAKLSGLPVTRYRYIARAMGCAFICLGGILVGARASAATVGSASGQLMPAMAAAIVGQSVAGAGKPNALGTLIGAILMGILENGLVMIGVPYYSMNAVKGAVLLIALAMAYVNSKEEA